MKIDKFFLNYSFKEGEEYKLVDNRLGSRNQILIGIAREYDQVGKIPTAIGKELESLFYNDEYVAGIYPTDESQVVDILENGIIHDINSNSQEDVLKLAGKVNFYNNSTMFMGEIKKISSSNASGAIVVKIPRYYLKNYTIHDVEKPIYYMDNNDNVRLLPEFVYGYVSVDSKFNIIGFNKNDKYNDILTYSNENLICDGEKINEVSNVRRNK